MEVYLGGKYKNTKGLVFEVIEYYNNKNIVVMFEKTGHTVKTNTSNIKAGCIRDPYAPSVAGVGITGEIPTSYRTKEGKIAIQPYYKAWFDMINRAYNKTISDRQRCYKNLTVTEEWLYLSNFKEWFDKHYIEGFVLSFTFLGKDIREYNKDTCVFIPQSINRLFDIRSDQSRDLPVGVSLLRGKNVVYGAFANNPLLGRLEALGRFDTPEEAHNAWQERKHEYALALADLYRDQLDPRVITILETKYAPGTKHC